MITLVEREFKKEAAYTYQDVKVYMGEGRMWSCSYRGEYMASMKSNGDVIFSEKANMQVLGVKAAALHLFSLVLLNEVVK